MDGGLETYEYVVNQKLAWTVLPTSMIVIEFFGAGDPFFGGSADDLTLGHEGILLSKPTDQTKIAYFDSIESAHHATQFIQNRRPNTILGVCPSWTH